MAPRQDKDPDKATSSSSHSKSSHTHDHTSITSSTLSDSPATSSTDNVLPTSPDTTTPASTSLSPSPTSTQVSDSSGGADPISPLMTNSSPSIAVVTPSSPPPSTPNESDTSVLPPTTVPASVGTPLLASVPPSSSSDASLPPTPSPDTSTPTPTPNKGHMNLVVILVPAIGGFILMLGLIYLITRIIRRRRKPAITQRSIPETESEIDFGVPLHHGSFSSLPATERKGDAMPTLSGLSLGGSNDNHRLGGMSLSSPPYPQQNVAARNIDSQEVPSSVFSTTPAHRNITNNRRDTSFKENAVSRNYFEIDLFSSGNTYSPVTQQSPPSQSDLILHGKPFTFADAYPSVDLLLPPTVHHEEAHSNGDPPDNLSYHRPLEPDRVKTAASIQDPPQRNSDDKRYTFQQYLDDLQQDIPSFKENFDDAYGGLEVNPFDNSNRISQDGPKEFGYAL